MLRDLRTILDDIGDCGLEPPTNGLTSCSGESLKTRADIVIGDLFDQLLDFRSDQGFVESRALRLDHALCVFEVPFACCEHFQNHEVLG